MEITIEEFRFETKNHLRDTKDKVVLKADGNEQDIIYHQKLFYQLMMVTRLCWHVLARLPKATSKTKDITWWPPRVVELFEARKPKDEQ